MTRITVDPDLRQRLRGLAEPIELCDEQGLLIGYVTPVEPVPDDLEIPELTAEELEAYRRLPPGRTLREIMADLEKRV